MATLAQYYQTKTEQNADSRSELKSTLSTIIENLASKQEDYNGKLEGLSELSQEITAIRDALAKALMPVDIENLAEQLREKLAEQRKKNAEFLAARLALEDERGRLEWNQEKLSKLEQEKKQIEQQLVDANKREARHIKWEEILSSDEFSDQVVLAQTLLDEKDTATPSEDPNVETIRAALSRVENDTPEELRARATERQVNINITMNGAGDAVNNNLLSYVLFRENNIGLSGVSENYWRKFLLAEKSMQDFSQTCMSFYDQAVSLLVSIVNSAELTEAEHDRINDSSIKDPVLDADALVKEKARDDAAVVVDSTYTAYRLAIMNAIAADPLTDPEPAASGAKNDYDDAVAALATAEGQLTQQMKDNIDIWEASVPNHIWQNLINYNRAIELLGTLTTTSPMALTATMDQAESELASTLNNEDNIIKKQYELEEMLKMSEMKHKSYQGSRQAMILSAVRGDN